MEENTPLKDNEPSNLISYNESEDMIEEDKIDNKGSHEERITSKVDIDEVKNMIEQETTEPEIMSLCRKDGQACELLQQCSKMASSKKWKSMKDFLESNEDARLSKVSKTSGTQYRNYIKNFYLGIANFRLRNYQEALNNFLDAHKIHQFYQLNYNIALCYMKLGNLENAVFYLEEVIKDNKKFFFAYYNLIKIFLKKNNINDAFLQYRDFSDIIKKQKEKEKVSQNTGLPLARNSVINFNTLKLFYKIGAECLFAKQLYQECVYTILEALRFNPNDIELWFLYAKVFVMKKNFPMSIALLKKALEIEPDYLEARRLLNFLEKNNED